VVVPERGPLLASRAYRDAVLGSAKPRVTLAYGQAAEEAGLHVMEAPTDHWVETATGLGATGVEVMLAHVAGRPLQAHRMVPLIQASSDPRAVERCSEDLDVVLEGDPDGWSHELLGAVVAVASRRYLPRLFGRGNTAFQLTRGLLGVSM
jgi:altronate dehydratase